MKFDLYVKNRFDSKIFITQFDPQQEQYNLYSTFNEKLSQSDNDQTTFTFSISKTVIDKTGNVVINPFLKYLKFGNQITLDTELDTYELIISQIEPQLNKSNVIYNFTCQDTISYKWPRIKLGYSYNTMERGGVRTIYQIANDILTDCGLNKNWLIKSTNSHIYPNSSLKTEKITLQVDGSNPYNALVEALNTLNASMLVDYRKHEIRFYQKDKVAFSGYRYRPETNLRSLSATYNIDELATILHVTGGTDETGMNVMLVPPIPKAINNYLQANDYTLPVGGYSAIIEQDGFTYTMYTTDTSGVAYEAYQTEIEEVNNFCVIADKVSSLGQFLYNFDFFRQNGAMSESQYNNIKQIIDVRMRNNNIKLKPLTVSYYNTLWEMQKGLIEVESKLEQMNASYMGLIKEYRKPNGRNEQLIGQFIADVNSIQFDIVNDFRTLIVDNYIALYGKIHMLSNGEFVPELQDIKNKVENYIRIRDEAKYYYYKYQDEYYALSAENDNNKHYYTIGTVREDNTTINYNVINLEADITYYYNRYYMALQMCGFATRFADAYGGDTTVACYWYTKEYLPNKTTPQDDIPTVTNDEEDDGQAIPYYRVLLLLGGDEIPEDQTTYGIYQVVQELEQINTDLWGELYTQYSDFIYEATYENSDEVDSVSLYNQAISYFEDYHHPKSSYSIEIINLEDLEQIGAPNLKVNSHIRVYNEDLNLNENGELNNISFTPNELIITGLDYELRKSATMSISVESVVQHQNILQKLIKSIR